MRAPKQFKLIKFGPEFGQFAATSSHGRIAKKTASSKRHQLIQSAGSLKAVLAAAHRVLALVHKVQHLHPNVALT